jgi:[glutamine synthetase] adenylyltransferase / [glutamine synthetase]-adenylyl-L-tyrosine phosphorylase
LVNSSLEKTHAHSPYWARVAAQPPASWNPALTARGISAEEIRDLMGAPGITDESALWRQLRDTRQHVILNTVARDLGGLANLDEVVRTVCALADECVRFALNWLTASLGAAYGMPVGEDSGSMQQLIVVGMGKLGGEELNVSSDIDLIFLYPEEGMTQGPKCISNHEYFTRLGRKLIAALSEPTAAGMVFRVDMRLRPYGDSGPLVASFSMLENYLHTQGREWERYAWLKARAITGSDAKVLEREVAPFVFRRHLDYSAIASLRTLHNQIREEAKRRDIADNIKLGPGGIREIEFIAQVFQLIRGGQDAALRTRSTRAALSLLKDKQLLPAGVVDELQAAYEYLRNLEHRLQYVEDQQTQTLPAQPGALRNIAASMGYEDAQGFISALNSHRESVSRHFEGIFASGGGSEQHPVANLWEGRLAPQDAHSQLQQLGYTAGERVLTRIGQLRESALFRRMSASTQGRLDALGPRIVEAASKVPNPDITFERLLNILESIGRREAYLALLLEYAGARERVVRLASASPWAASYLARHPVLLDELVSDRQPEPPDWPALGKELRATLDQSSDGIDRQMDLLRNFKQVHTFRLLIQDLAGQLPLESLSDHLSDLASTIVQEVLRLCWSHLNGQHAPRFAVIGYGKWGGKELGYASDLDLIFLYDADDALEGYTRLAQRVNTWLTTFTPAGILYDIDLRLRPDGDAGMLVSHIGAFEEYQLHKAWVFEHQAMTRARCVAGDAQIGARFEALRQKILTTPRDLATLRGEIASMRQRMHEGHPNKSALFDIKHDRGGIVDVEFIVQYLVLGYAHQHPALTGNIGNLALLKLAASLGLIPGELASAVHRSYREFRRMQHSMRLQDERYARSDPAKVQPLVAPVLALWRAVFD